MYNTMTYGAETWALTAQMEQKLSAAQHKMERSMMNISYQEHKTNEWVRQHIGLKDILKKVKIMTLKWAGELNNYWKTQLWPTKTKDRELWSRHAEAFIQQWIADGS